MVVTFGIVLGTGIIPPESAGADPTDFTPAPATEAASSPPASDSSAEHLKQANALLRRLRHLEVNARNLSPLRETTDEAKLTKCATLMHRLLPDVKAARASAEALPLRFRVQLGAAATSVELCATCRPVAVEHCDRAVQALNDAEEQLSAVK